MSRSITRSPNARVRNQVGAATAEYAAVTAVGCGFASILITLLTSDYGQELLKMLLDFFFKMVGIG